MPWYYGWNIVAAAMLFQAVTMGISFYSFTFWVPYWTEEFSQGRAAVMLVFLALQTGMGILSPFVGRASDSVPLRWMVACGGLCFSGALLLSSYANALWQIGVLYGTVLVLGLALAGPVPAMTLAAKWFPKKNSGLAMGLVATGTSLGGLLIPPLITYLQAESGWRIANTWLAGISFVLIMFSALVIRNSPEKGESPATKNIAIDSKPTLAVNWTTRTLLLSPVFLALVVCITTASAAFLAIQQNLAPLARDYNIDPQSSAFIVSMVSFSAIGSKLLFGYLADRWSHRLLYLLALAILGICLLSLYTLALDYWILMAIACLLGIGTGGILPLIGAIIISNFGVQSFGRVRGLSTLFFNASALGPWIAASVYDLSGSYDNAWLILCILLFPMIYISRLFSPEIPNKYAATPG